MRSSPLFHGFLALSAVALVGVVAFQSGALVQGSVMQTEDPLTADIAFEHQAPLAAHIKMSILKGEALIEVSHEGAETVFVSVPEHWRRSEVRDVPLHEVTSEPPMLGFTRWTLPAGATVTFYSLDAPTNVLVHNPGGMSLKVRGILVNLNKETTSQDIVLVQDEPTVLWE